MNAAGLPPSPPSSRKSTAVVGGEVVGETVVVSPVVVVAIPVVETSVVEAATVDVAAVVAVVVAVVVATVVVGVVVVGVVVVGVVVGGVVVAVVAMGGWGSEVQSLRLRVGAGDVVAAGGVNLGGGIFAATLSSENDHPSNVPGGGWRLPAPSVA
jgi:hypothetical protein